MNLKRVSLAAVTVLTVAVISLLLRRSLFAHGAIAIVLQVAAGVLMLWARATLGHRSFHAEATPTAGDLVMSGPYRLVRHPIYAAILLFMWTGIASHGSILSVLTGIVATAALAVRIGAEEALLAGVYPEYADYARRTRRVVPFLV